MHTVNSEVSTGNGSLRAVTLKTLVIVKKLITFTIIPVILLITWQSACNAGLIPPIVLPKPTKVGSTFIFLIKDGELFHHLLVSILRVFQGYLVGAGLGLVLGILIALFRTVEDSLAILTGIFRPIPVMAWVPLIILWMGIDEPSKITLVAIGTFWTVLVNVIQGIKGTDKKYIEVAYIFEKSKLTLLIKVILPSALPFIFSGLRVGVDVAWRSVVGAEVVAASAGLGYLITFSRELGQTDAMLVGIFAIGLLGLLIDCVLRKLQKRMLIWDQNLEKQ